MSARIALPRPRRQPAPRLRPLLAALLAAGLVPATLAQTVGTAALPANALPQGGAVVVGAGRMAQTGNELLVKQSSARLGIDWQRFDIGSAAAVEFQQPDRNSVVLNRVVGNDGSQIFGQLRANGQVFLVNPNGVLFAPGAQVDVGAMVASSLDLSQQDFAAGNYRFSGAGGAVTNQGRITASAGGYVALFGGQVANGGEITVPAGTVMLASGRAATVSISDSGLLSAALTPGAAGSVVNSGAISADGGVVRLSAQSAAGLAASLVNNTGIIRANAIVERGGEVWIAGDDVATSGRISADGGAGRSAGRIVVQGDMQQGSATIGGELSASAAGGGNGGTVETSAARVAIAPGTRVDTLADAGRNGTWTIDPTDFGVNAGGGSATTSGIGADTLASNLGSGNVTLSTAVGGSDPGDLSVNAPVAWSASTTLTLNAARNVNVNASLSATGATAALVLAPGSGGAYKLASGAQITLSGSNPGLSIAGTSYVVINDVNALQAIGANSTSLGKSYALGSDIGAGATASWNSGAGFVPLGNNYYYYYANGAFNGNFDGFNHRINGLTINRPAESFVGLFGSAYNASIANVSLQGGSVTGGQYVGALVGYASGTTSLAQVSSNLPVNLTPLANTTGYVGGAAGYFSGTGGIAGASTSGAVYTDAASAYAGGVVGYQTAGTLTASQASGSVSAGGSSSYAGGLAGYYYGTQLAGSSASGAVSAGSVAGGLVGEFYASGTGTLSNSSASGTVSGGASYVGGLVGYLYGNITTSFASGNVQGGNSSYAGGLVGYDSGGQINDSAASGAVTGGYGAGGLAGYVYGYGATSIANSRASGAVAAGANGGAAGGLAGYFYSYDNSSTAPAISNATASGSVSGDGYVGGLVGYYAAYRPIADSAASGAVLGGLSNRGQTIGGLAGFVYDYASTSPAILRSYASGSVTLSSAAAPSAYVYAGGLVGQMYAYYNSTGVSDSYASGAVSATGTSGAVYAGGLIGYAYGGVDKTYASGKVTAASMNAYTGYTQVGGLIGYLSSGSVTNSYFDLAGTGQSGSAGGTGLAGGAMTAAASFTGWNLAGSAGSGSTWRIYEGHTAPLLSHFLTPLTLTLADASKTYDGTTSFGDATITASGGAAVAHPDRIFAALPSANAGSYSVAAAQLYSTQTGYDLSASGSATLTVNRRPLTLAGVVADKVYDGTVAATLSATAAPSGLVPGEDLKVNTGAVNAVFADKKVGANKLVTLTGYTLADGAVGKASNYTLADRTDATATITPRPLTAVNLAATDRAYDGTLQVGVTATATGSLGGVIAGDQVALSLSPTVTATMADPHAGTGKPVTVSGVGLAGADAGNYSVAGIGAVSVDITPRQYTVNGLVAASKVYDGGTYVTIDASSAVTGGALAGDAVLLRNNGVSGNTADKSVGSGKAVTVSGLSLAGIAAPDYSLSVGALVVDVTPRPVIVSAYNSSGEVNKVYDGTTAAQATLYPNYNWDGSNLVVSATGIAYADKNVGTGKTITAGGLALSGSAAGNYTLSNSSATTTGNITPKPLAVSGVNAVDRAYDGTVNVAVNVGSVAVDTSKVVAGDQVGVVTPGSGATTGTMADKNVGSNKPVTVSGLTLTGTAAANYTLSGAGSGVTVNISKKNLTASYTGVDKVYDGTAYASLTATSGDIVAGDNVLFLINYYSTYYGYYGYATFTAGKDVGSNKAIGIASASYNDLYGTDAANYSFTNPTGAALATANITPKGITPVFAGGSKVYDGSTTAPVTLNASASGVISSDTVTLSDTAVFTDSKNVGSNKPISISNIAFVGANASNYALSTTSASTTGAVTPKPLALTGISATDRVYDGTLTVAVSASNPGVSGVVTGDAVTLVAPSGGVSSGTMADKNVGTAKPVAVGGFTLSGGDAANYGIAAASAATVDISAKPLTASYTGVNRVYNGGVSAAVQGGSADIVSGDSVSFTQSAAFTGDGAKNVGSAKPIAVSSIAIGGTDAANYALQNTAATASASITPRPISVGYAGVDRVYDGVADRSASVVGSASQLVAGDVVGFTQSAQFTGDGSAGVAKPVLVSGIALAGGDAANYQLTSTTASTTATIRPKTLGVAGVTATDRRYDGTTLVSLSVAGAAVDLTGVVAGDSVGVTLPASGLTTGTMADANVGDFKPVALSGLGLTGASMANYTLVGATGVTVDIMPLAITASWLGIAKVYDGSTAAAVTASSTDILAADAGQVGFGALAAFTGTGAKNVGNAKPVAISAGFLTGSQSGNYSLANPTGSTTASITPRSVTAGYSGGSKVYDGGIAAPVTGTISGEVAGDDLSLAQSAVFSGTGAKNVGSGKPIAVSAITLGGGDAGNYALAATSAATSGSITPKPLTVTGLASLSATDRVYDGTRVVAVNVPAGVLDASSSDVVAGDDVSVNVPPAGATTGTMADKNIGNSKPVVVTGLSLAGADAGNYRIAGAAGLTVKITPKSLTAAYAGVDKVYDGTAIATVAGSSGDIVAGDAVAIGGSGVFSAGKNVGSGKAVAVLAGTLTGTDAANYTLVDPAGSTTASITPRTVAAVYSGGSRVYDGSVAAPVAGTISGEVAGDDLSLAQSAVFTGAGAKNVGSGKPIAVSAIALGGGDAGNYALAATSAAATGSITPRPLAVSGLGGIKAVDRVYDGTVSVQLTGSSGAVVPSTSDIITGDQVAVALGNNAPTRGTMADKQAGSNKPVVVDGLSLTGADAANYVIAGTVGVTANIAPKPVTLAGLSAVDRIYDGTKLVAIDTAGGQISGALAGDAVALLGSGVSGSMADKNVGSSKPVTVTGVALTGADAIDYVVSGNGALQVNIAPRPLALVATAQDKVYDATTAASVSYTDNRIAGDLLTIGQQAANFADKNVGSAKPVSVSGVSLAGVDAGNYVLASSGFSLSASITPRPLSLAAQPASKVYGDALVFDGSAFQATGLAGGETVGQVRLSSAGALPAAGVAGSPYAIDIAAAQGGSFDAANYAITYLPGLLNVTPRPLTIATSSVVRYVDEPNPTGFGFSTSVAGLVNGDTVASVQQPVPAGSTSAAAGSVFELLPSAAVFGAGSAANYDLHYAYGLLLVLPAPPRVGEANNTSAGASSAVQYLVQVDAAEVQGAIDQLARDATPPPPPPLHALEAPPLPTGALPGPTPPGPPQPVTIEALLKLPLVSYDPTLWRRMFGDGADPSR